MKGTSKLFSFIFLTVKASANNPKAKNFLPNLLSGIENSGSKLFPLTEEEWKIGTLKNQSGSFIAQNIADSYFELNSQNVIPYPKSPYPSLNLKDNTGVQKVTINGLDNAYITGFDNYKYEPTTQNITADLKLQFNYWTNNPAGLLPNQKITPLGLKTPFILKQQLCNSDSQESKACLDATKEPITIIGEGSFTADISQLNFIASINISVKPNRAGLDFQITKLKLSTTGSDAPKFKNVKAQIKDSPLKGIISNLIESFMSQAMASDAFFTQMEASLNGPDIINTISNTLKAQIANFLNARLGPVNGQLPSDSNQPDTNMVDMYLFDRIRYSLNNPASSWYFQTLLNKYNNHYLNQFKLKSIDFGNKLKGFKNASISNIVVTGLPNATSPAKEMIIAPPSLHMKFVLGAIAPRTKIDLHFSSSEITFDMHTRINNASFTIQVTPSGGTANDLNIQFNSLVFDIPEPTDFISKVSGVACPGSIEDRINNKSFLDKITSEINDELQKNLEKISTNATTMVRGLLNKQLGGGKN